jgi:hypothetical protein
MPEHAVAPVPHKVQGETLIAVNHSPITNHMLMCLAAEGRIDLNATVVINTRGAKLSLPAHHQLTAPLGELHTIQLALQWIAAHLAYITHCRVLVPQTQEPFYAALAAVGASFDYIEEGVGTHTFLRLFASRNRPGILVTRAKAFVKANARAAGVVRRPHGIKPDQTYTELARLFVRRPICTFMDVGRAQRIFTFSKWTLRNVVCVDFTSGIQTSTSAPARDTLRPEALILLPPRALSERERDLLKMHLRRTNIARALVKYHPASPTREALSTHLPDVSLEELSSEWNMHEPVVLCATHNIGFLIHFGSSAGIYAPIFNRLANHHVSELDVTAPNCSVLHLTGGAS